MAVSSSKCDKFLSNKMLKLCNMICLVQEPNATGTEHGYCTYW